jgi:hypothetical protein
MSKPIADTFEEQIKLINPNKPVKVYRNLNRRVEGEDGFWSVKQGTVKFHCRIISLKEANFLVNERVRLRVIENKRKEVHAFVEGYLCDALLIGCREVTYNPYRGDSFISGNTPVIGANFCTLAKCGNSMKVFIDHPSIPC